MFRFDEDVKIVIVVQLIVTKLQFCTVLSYLFILSAMEGFENSM